MERSIFGHNLYQSRSPLIDTQNISVRPTLRPSRRESSAEAPANTWAACVQKNSSKTNIFLSSISQFFKHLEWNPPSGHYNCGHLNTQQNYTEKVMIKVCFLALLTRSVFFSLPFGGRQISIFRWGLPPRTTSPVDDGALTWALLVGRPVRKSSSAVRNIAPRLLSPHQVVVS